MFDCCDTKLLQELARQTWKNRLVYLILAESRLIAFEATSKISIVTQSRPRWCTSASCFVSADGGSATLALKAHPCP